MDIWETRHRSMLVCIFPNICNTVALLVTSSSELLQDSNRQGSTDFIRRRGSRTENLGRRAWRNIAEIILNKIDVCKKVILTFKWPSEGKDLDRQLPTLLSPRSAPVYTV
jgi:hypothetical protein